MSIRKPRHATVVAYLALFVALGGTALAAQARFGASDLKHPIVRNEKFRPSAAGGVGTVVVRCKKNERLISGGGGWNSGPADSPAPTLSEAAIVRAGGGRATGFVVQGQAPALNNTLVAQAICLPE
jgi:hypothetical protein